MVHGETQWASWRIYFNSSLSGTHARTHAHAHTHIHARNPQRGAIIPSSTYGRTDTRSNFLKYWLARVKEKVINERCPSSPLHGFSSRGTFSSINPPNCLNIALSAQPSRRREPRSAKCRPWSGTRSTVLRGSAFSEFLTDSPEIFRTLVRVRPLWERTECQFSVWKSWTKFPSVWQNLFCNCSSSETYFDPCSRRPADCCFWNGKTN